MNSLGKGEVRRAGGGKSSGVFRSEGARKGKWARSPSFPNGKMQSVPSGPRARSSNNLGRNRNLHPNCLRMGRQLAEPGSNPPGCGTLPANPNPYRRLQRQGLLVPLQAVPGAEWPRVGTSGVASSYTHYNPEGEQSTRRICRLVRKKIMGGPTENYGGGRGIRTPERLSTLTVFKTAGFNHSPIPPQQVTSFLF